MVTVATGLWHDHSEPSILNATWTLPLQQGTLLLSALTVLVGFAGASFWNIAAFLIHSRRIKGGQALAIELQQQVSLRNTSGSAGTLWQAFKMHRAWAGPGGAPPNLWRRTLAFALPAALVWCAFTAAGLFTSRVASKSYGGAVARVKPDNCGFWQYDAGNERALAAHNTKVINDTVQARTYVTSFYANTSSSPTARSLFLRPVLPYNTSTSAPCPIPDAERCVLGHDGAFSMTTAPLDSHAMLGINAKPADRITVQISVTCSPIHSAGLASNVTDGRYNFLELGFGPIPGASNFTYIYNLLTPGTDATYLLVPRYATAGAPSPVWVPIPQLNRTDADVSIYFLSQNILAYMDPVYDPWFSANGTYTRAVGNGTYLYEPDYLVNTLVCADQFVFCNPSSGTCTARTGLYGAESSLQRNAPGFAPAQLATAGRILIALTNSNTYNSVVGLGAGALFANNLVFGTVSAGLPDNQWRVEVLGWFQTGLAKLQAYVVQYAANAGDLGPYGTVVSKDNAQTNNSADRAAFAALRDQCANQLVQVASEVQNFSFLGVMIIVCTAVALLLLDWSQESIANCVNRRGGHAASPAPVARQADNMLHLLRLAVGNPAGHDNEWQEGRWAVPVLANGLEQYNRPEDGGGGDLARYHQFVAMEEALPQANSLQGDAREVQDDPINVQSNSNLLP